MQTLEQRRAADALEKVTRLREQTGREEWNDQFTSYVESLAPSILANGLGQAAASLLARAKGDTTKAHYVLYQYLQEWLCRETQDAPYPPGNLMQALVSGDRNAYLHAQVEAVAWLQWLKRFATAYLKKPDGFQG